MAYDIDAAEKKKALLLTLCGEQVYETVCTFVHPKVLTTVSYDELVAALMAHFDLCPFQVDNCKLFQRRDQLSGESVSAYIMALWNLAADCKFGTPNPTTQLYTKSTMLPLNAMLQDRFV